MGNIFAASEIIELGIQIEKNGRDFYSVLQDNSKDDRCIELFKYLAGEESKHIIVFENILGRVERYQPSGLGSDEYYAYMKALADEHIFTQKDKGRQIASGIKTTREALDLGIGFEKDSIVFYEGIKEAVAQEEHKIVDEVIAQEQKHLFQLLELKRSL